MMIRFVEKLEQEVNELQNMVVEKENEALSHVAV